LWKHHAAQPQADKVNRLALERGERFIKRYGARAVGFEIDPLRYLWCQLLIRILGLRDRVRVIYGDFFNRNLSDADVVTCYLLQSTNNKLQKKLKQELRPGARVVSNTFTFPGLHRVRQDGEARVSAISRLERPAAIRRRKKPIPL
jgi:hypothetical protein